MPQRTRTGLDRPDQTVHGLVGDPGLRQSLVGPVTWNLDISLSSVIPSSYRSFSTVLCIPHTPPFNGPFFGTTRVSRYQKGKTNLNFTEARDSEWQCRQLGHMQVCTSLQTDNHANNPPLSFLQAGCPSSSSIICTVCRNEQ